MFFTKKVTFAEMRDRVKSHIKDMLQRQSMREYEYIDIHMQQTINLQTEVELAELALAGNLEGYYKRVLKGAV